MKRLIILFLFLFPLFASAQYNNVGNALQRSTADTSYFRTNLGSALYMYPLTQFSGVRTNRAFQQNSAFWIKAGRLDTLQVNRNLLLQQINGTDTILNDKAATGGASLFNIVNGKLTINNVIPSALNYNNTAALYTKEIFNSVNRTNYLITQPANSTGLLVPAKSSSPDAVYGSAKPLGNGNSLTIFTNTHGVVNSISNGSGNTLPLALSGLTYQISLPDSVHGFPATDITTTYNIAAPIALGTSAVYVPNRGSSVTVTDWDLGYTNTLDPTPSNSTYTISNRRALAIEPINQTINPNATAIGQYGRLDSVTLRSSRIAMPNVPAGTVNASLGLDVNGNVVTGSSSSVNIYNSNGALTGNRILDLAGNTLNLGANSTTLFLNEASTIASLTAETNTGKGTEFDAFSTYGQMLYTDATGNQQNIYMNGGANYIRINASNNHGIGYVIHPNFAYSNHILTDRVYVDSAILAHTGGSYTASNGVILTGSNFTSDTTYLTSLAHYNGVIPTWATNRYVAKTGLSATTPLSYNSSTGSFTIQQATTSQSGYLSSTDWNTFNNKQVAGSYFTLGTPNQRVTQVPIFQNGATSNSVWAIREGAGLSGRGVTVTDTANTALLTQMDYNQFAVLDGTGFTNVTRSGMGSYVTSGSLSTQLNFATPTGNNIITIPNLTGTMDLNVFTTTGDIAYSSSGTTASRLGIGSTNQVLTVISGVPSWQTPASVPTGANPTAAAGNSAVNGSAATFMRSDGAPRVDSTVFVNTTHYNGIIPTWATNRYAPLASPALTGTPTAPTATVGTNTTQIATTAFVLANAGGTSFANPTGTQGLTTVNGSATTAMRSDATFPFNQALAPTNTGLWIFSLTNTASSGTANYGFELNPIGNQTLTAGFTDFYMNSTGTFGSGVHNLMSLNLGGTNEFLIDKSGNVTSASSITATTNLTGNVVYANSDLIVQGGTAHNIYFPTGNNLTSTTTSTYQLAGSSTVYFKNGFGASTNPGIPSGTNVANNIFSASPFQTVTTGTTAWFTNVLVKAPVVTLTGSSFLTNYATLYVEAPGAIATNNYPIYITSGTSYLSKIALVPSSGSATDSILTHNPTTGVINAMPAPPTVLATITGINAKSTGTTALYTVPTGKTCVVTAVIVRCTAATAISAGPSADVGDSVNGAASVYANTAITALTSTIKAFGYSTVGMIDVVAAGSVINFNINTASTGTSQTVAVDLVGYLR